MKKFKIITDSCCDLPQDFIEKMDVDYIPLKFSINGKEYSDFLDKREMSSKQFYDLIRNEHALPTTSQINSDEYIQKITPYLKEGVDVLVIAFSSALSGTFNSARLAAIQLNDEYNDSHVEVIDSKSASLGQGILVKKAITCLNEGKTLFETKKIIEDYIFKIAHWFTVSDINHLKRGGRVSSISALVANMLTIKPILHVSNEGKLISKSKALGRKKSMSKIIEVMAETITNKTHIYISHGDCLDDAQKLASLIKERFNPQEIFIYPVGAVIGSHSGPDTLAVFFEATSR